MNESTQPPVETGTRSILDFLYQMLEAHRASKPLSAEQVLQGMSRAFGADGAGVAFPLEGVPIVTHRDRLKCGLVVVDLRTGGHAAHLEFRTGVEEIFDVQVLPGILSSSLGMMFEYRLHKLVQFFDFVETDDSGLLVIVNSNFVGNVCRPGC